jgi:hypothetical protein
VVMFVRSEAPKSAEWQLFGNEACGRIAPPRL